MKTLADWYPGNAVVFACIEVLAMITILVALTWLAARFLARRSVVLRDELWLSALVGVLLTPALALFGSQLPWHIPLLPDGNLVAVQPSVLAPNHGEGQTRSLPRRETATTNTMPAPDTSRSEVRVPTPIDSATPQVPKVAAVVSDESPPPANLLHALLTLGLIVWVVGSIYVSARALHGWLSVIRIWRRLRPLDEKQWTRELAEVAQTLSLAHRPDVFVSSEVRSPVVIGVLSPRVVFPEVVLERCTSDQFCQILIHECAHVVRRDPWVRVLQCLSVVLFWVHPLVALLNRRLNQAREEVCDNHALKCADAPDYAETLLTIVQICHPRPGLRGHLTMITQGHSLEARVTELLDEKRDKSTCLPARQRVAVLLTLVLALVAFASVGLYGTAGDQNEKRETFAAVQTPPAKKDNGLQRAPAGQVSGVVHAADGSPAAGAVVWAAKVNFGPLERQETVADAKGQYVLALDAGEWFLWARRGSQGGYGEGLVRHRAVEIVAGKAAQIEIRLEERGTFRGRLLEAETGKPINGGQFFLDEGLVLTSGVDGRFQVGGMARGGHEAFVVAPGRMRMRVLFDTTARVDTELEVSVPRSGKIVGRVTDKNGKPVAGAYVGRPTSGSYFSINGLYLACDAAGRFEYDDAVPPDQPTWLSAGAPGYIDENIEGLVVPAEGRPLEVKFRLRSKPDEPVRTVSGTVRGPDKMPVAGVLVRWGFAPETGAIEARTDEKGGFRLSVPDKAGTVAVLPRDFKPQFPAIAKGGDRSVEVVLEEGRTARGRVLDDAGRPVKDVFVIAVVSSPDPQIGNPYWLHESAVYTDAQGNFNLKGIPDGARFDFLKAGLSDRRNHELKLGSANAVTMDNAVATLAGGAIIGRVVDRDDKPVRNFRVLVNFPREQRPGDKLSGHFAGYCRFGVHFTSADGSFVLTGVGAGGVHRIEAIAEGHGEAVLDRVTAVPWNPLKIAAPVILKAGPPIALRVRAVTSAGKPVAGARVTLVNGQPGLDAAFSWGYHDASWEDMTRRRTAADGWANFPALSFRDATVLIQAPGYGRRRIGWRKGEKELMVELAPEAAITGEVRDDAGAPIKDFYVDLESGGDRISSTASRDDKGRFRMGELPQGEWTIAIRDGDGRSTLHEGKVTLKPGETKELKMELKIDARKK